MHPPANPESVFTYGAPHLKYGHGAADEIGMGRLFTQFSFPGGIPSHVAPETP